MLIVGVNLPKEARKKQMPKRLDGSNETTANLTATQANRMEYFNVIDLVVNAVKARFDQKGLRIYSNIEYILCHPQDSHTDNSEKIISELSEAYTLNKKLVKDELFILSKDGTLKADNVVDFLESFKENLSANQTVYPLLGALLTIVLLLPATNATSERSFSAMKRLKTAMRNSMGQRRLNSLLLLHTYKKETDQIDPQAIISDFVKGHSKRERTIALKLQG